MAVGTVLYALTVVKIVNLITKKIPVSYLYDAEVSGALNRLRSVNVCRKYALCFRNVNISLVDHY